MDSLYDFFMCVRLGRLGHGMIALMQSMHRVLYHVRNPLTLRLLGFQQGWLQDKKTAQIMQYLQHLLPSTTRAFIGKLGWWRYFWDGDKKIMAYRR